MTHDEARRLLVGQTALLVTARVKEWNAEREVHEAAAPLYEAEEAISEITPDEQLDCFRESCGLAGIDPKHPALRPFWTSMRDLRDGHYESRLQDQLANADLN